MNLLKTYKKFSQGQKIAFWAIVVPVFVAVANLFAAPAAEILVARWLATNTPTPTVTPTATVTVSPTITPTNTNTLSPTFPLPSPSSEPTNTNTPTYTPETPTIEPSATETPFITETSSPTPIPPGTIRDGCLPAPWRGEDLPLNQDGCIEPEALIEKGVVPIDGGLRIYSIARTNNQLERFAIKLPVSQDISSIKFKVKLSNLQESYRGQPSEIYFGIASGQDPNLEGTYLLFDKSPEEESIYSSYLYDRYPALLIPRRSLSAYNQEDIIDVEIIFDTNSFDILNAGNRAETSPFSLAKIREKDPCFVIGYVVGPGGGILSVEITEFSITYR